MQRFAHFLLKGRRQAAFLAVIFACLPYFTWLSAAIVGFITLRKGRGEGFLVMLWSILPAVVMTAVTHNWLLLVSRVFLGALLVWLLVSVFLRLPRWTLLVLLATLAGALMVILFHLFVPDTVAWWQAFIIRSAAQFESSLGVNQAPQAAEQVAHKIAYIATGLNAALFVFATLVQLLLARFLDRSLPGAVHATTELKRLRMPVWLVPILFANLIFCFWSALLLDLLPVIILPFFVAGCSLVANLLVRRLSPLTLMFVLFALLIALMIMPILAVFVACLAVFDSMFNLHQRFGDKRSK